MKVSIGSIECLVSTISDTEITCIVLGGDAGTYELFVYIEGIGNSNPKTFELKFEIDSITPSSGSIKGGTEITISGSGFSTKKG